jgi:hypothetical protein
MRALFATVAIAVLTQLLWAQDNNVLRSAESPLKNPSFEIAASDRPGEPETWNLFTESGEVGLSRLCPEAAQHGQQSMSLAFDSPRDKFLGIAQEVAAAAGEKWKFSGFVRNSGMVGTTHLKLGIEWKNGENQELRRNVGNKIDRTNTSNREWTAVAVEGQAPAGTTHATLTVTFFVGDAEAGSVLLDTFWMEKIP